MFLAEFNPPVGKAIWCGCLNLLFKVSRHTPKVLNSLTILEKHHIYNNDKSGTFLLYKISVRRYNLRNMSAANIFLLGLRQSLQRLSLPMARTA